MHITLISRALSLLFAVFRSAFRIRAYRRRCQFVSSSLSSVCQIEFKNICSTIFRSPAGYRRAKRRVRRVAQPERECAALSALHMKSQRARLSCSEFVAWFSFLPLRSRSDANTHTPARAHQREHAHTIAKINS